MQINRTITRRPAQLATKGQTGKQTPTQPDALALEPLFWDVYAVTGSLDRIDAIERQAARTRQSTLSVMAEMNSVFRV